MSGHRRGAGGAGWVALAACGRLDLPALGRLHTTYGDPAAAAAAIAAGHDSLDGVLSPSAAARAARDLGRHAAADVAAWLSARGGTVLGVDVPGWPAALTPPSQWPAALTLLGRLDAAPAVAIVGMRRCSDQGAAFARRLAAELAREGVSVVSGLAYGIDVAAHLGALDAGGRTVAVIAGGLGRISPRCHVSVADSIVGAGGALVSHLPPACDSPGWRFPIRNRLVAGLADVVVVVEAAARGGALSTARHARDLGRPLLAVPGPPWDGHADGSVALLADGAAVCRDADDVLVALGIARSGRRTDPSAACAVEAAGLDSFDAALLSAVAPVPVAIEDLARRVESTTFDVLCGLGRLELAGLVTFPRPGLVARAAPPQPA